MGLSRDKYPIRRQVIPTDYFLVLSWLGLRLVTCARDAGEMVFFTPS
jgi:hypothetical protein